MIPLETLRELFEYNHWARDRQLEACATLTDEQLRRPAGNSFSSVRDTLAHLVGVEWLWLERWRGRSTGALPTADAYPTIDAIRDHWRVVEQGVREYLAGLDDRTLAQPLVYTNLKGEPRTYPLWRVLVHLLNHQTYHRGQVTTLLRQLGVQAPALDFLVADDMGLFQSAGPATASTAGGS